MGSGEGYAESWFQRQGIICYACEGLGDNVRRAVHPTIHLDLVRSKLTFPVDLVHCGEVVEHIGVDHIANLTETLCNGHYVLMTHAVPGQEGHHHVNCQPASYWIELFSDYGYTLLEPHTACIRKIATKEAVPTFFAQSGLVFTRQD